MVYLHKKITLFLYWLQHKCTRVMEWIEEPYIICSKTCSKSIYNFCKAPLQVIFAREGRVANREGSLIETFPLFAENQCGRAPPPYRHIASMRNSLSSSFQFFLKDTLFRQPPGQQTGKWLTCVLLYDWHLNRTIDFGEGVCVLAGNMTLNNHVCQFTASEAIYLIV